MNILRQLGPVLVSALCYDTLLALFHSLQLALPHNILRPFYSLNRLEISEACMARIVAHAHVSADFFKYLQAFRQKSYA